MVLFNLLFIMCFVAIVSLRIVIILMLICHLLCLAFSGVLLLLYITRVKLKSLERT